MGSRIELPLAAVGSDQAPRRADYIIMDDNDIAAAGGAFADQPLPALHLVRVPADEHDVHIELWLGRQMDYLPIRLLIIQPDGDRLDMTLQDIRAGNL